MKFLKQPTRITITQDTSINQIVDFLNYGNSKSRIRARDLKEGGIELYVRKNSLKQFFTDKLRLRCHVEQDYNAARNLILDIIKKADPAGENSFALLSIKNSVADNKHDFRLHEFSENLNSALTGGVELAKQILELHGSPGNPDCTTGQFLRNEAVKAEISKVMNSITNPNDKKIFEKNFNALKSVTEKPNPFDSTLLTNIDYNCAIDFFRVWLKETKETDPDTKNLSNKSGNEVSPKKTALTEMAERVTRRGVPSHVDLNGGKLENSDADLIVFDSYTVFRPIQDPCNSGSRFSEVTPDGKDNEDVNFKIKEYTQNKENAETETKKTAILGVNYLQGPIINQLFMNSLYDDIEETIREKMSKNTGDDQIFKIHLPILHPFLEDKLQPDEKTMMLKSFAEATQKWAHRYPNLEIKVYLPEGISESDMQRIYRDLNKIQRTN